MTTATTPQQRLKAELEKSGIPFKNIECYGSQIVVTSWSHEAATKWATLLGRFATVRGVVKVADYTNDTSDYFKANPGLVKSIFMHEVWRTFAAV